mgnify:CR=1 FL=1
MPRKDVRRIKLQTGVQGSLSVCHLAALEVMVGQSCKPLGSEAWSVDWGQHRLGALRIPLAESAQGQSNVRVRMARF